MNECPVVSIFIKTEFGDCYQFLFIPPNIVLFYDVGYSGIYALQSATKSDFTLSNLYTSVYMCFHVYNELYYLLKVSIDLHVQASTDILGFSSQKFQTFCKLV